MKYRRAQHLISHPLVPSSMLWRFSDFALSDFLGKYWVLKGAQEDESAMRQLTPRSKKHLDWDSFGTTCNVIELVYQENVLLTLSENYMRSIFCIRYHHQGWLSTLKSAHTENIANCSEVWTSLKRLPFVLQNTARVHFEVVHGYSFHTERHSRKKKPWNAISMNVRFSASILLLYKSVWMAPQHLSTQAFLSSVSC